MKNIALLTCKEIDKNACNDDELIISPLASKGINATFEIWNDHSVDWRKYDACIIRSTWDYTEHIKDFLSFLNDRQKHLSLFNSFEIINRNFDKSYLFELEKNGFEIVPSLLLPRNEKSLIQAQEIFQTTKIISKPTVGAGASGLVFHKDSKEVVEDGGQFIYQPFLETIQEDGEISLIFFNGEFSHAILKIPKKGDFRSQEEFGSKITEFSPCDETLKYSKNALESFAKDTLLSRVDLLKNDQGQWRRIGEIELIEPALYLSFSRNAENRFIDAIISRLS